MSTEPGPAASAPTHWPLADATALCSAIASGRLDADLSAIIASINRRTAAIAASRTTTALSRLTIGTRVRLDQRVKPQYLRGEVASVHELDGTVVVVLLDRVVGRFASRHVRCAPEVLELIDET